MKASEARAKAIEAMDKNIECHEELEKIYKKIEDQANKHSILDSIYAYAIFTHTIQ